MIVENDVRLLRRFLIARQYNDGNAIDALHLYLQLRPFLFVSPGYDHQDTYKPYLNRLSANERWLAERFGFVILPDYHDTIFLNSKWENPRTLYVRLLEPIPALGKLGEIYWYPEPDEAEWRKRAEKNHKEYMKFCASLMDNGKKSWLDRLLGR